MLVRSALLTTVLAGLAGIGWFGLIAPGPAPAQLPQGQKPFWDAVVTGQQVVNWLTAGDLGPEVRVGCPGWLFLNDELEVHRTRAANLAGHLKIVEQVAGFLARRHIPLMVVLVPDKTRVEADAMCRLQRPAALQERLPEAIARLREAGIAVIDLLPALNGAGGDAYYRTDAHWNERGASRAAATIAAALRERGLATDQKAQFRVRSEPPRERVGDLIALAGLDRVPFPLRPRGDIVSTTVIEQSAPTGTGLLEATAAPDTVLLGTSFSKRANFGEFLAMSLGAPIANWAQSGGGLSGAAVTYFAAPAFTQSPPRVVVWELPERILEEKRVTATERRWGDELAQVPPPREYDLVSARLQ